MTIPFLSLPTQYSTAFWYYLDHARKQAHLKSTRLLNLSLSTQNMHVKQFRCMQVTNSMAVARQSRDHGTQTLTHKSLNTWTSLPFNGKDCASSYATLSSLLVGRATSTKDVLKIEWNSHKNDCIHILYCQLASPILAA